jgi:DNA-binding helix-hairpin-helix protein with protein kinase domain
MLMLGQKINSVYNDEVLTVVRKLGEGGQGAVYRVEDGKGRYKALKWYSREQSTPKQRQAIEQLVRQKLTGEEAKFFVWPQDLALVDGEYQRFGYVMEEIDMRRFATLGEVMAKLKNAPYMRQRCIISENLAAAFRALHLQGYYYSDISMDNFLFDPKNGDILICDNDNVGIQDLTKAQVLGTMEFMAPEVILGEKKPSKQTDLYSLAVLLFYFWIWHHPMHGMLEYNIRIWDLPAKRKVYGEAAVFIFDEDDRQNELPDDSDYLSPKLMWKACPKPLQDLFRRAFTAGVRDVSSRVNEGEWQKTFAELKEHILTCSCKAQNFWWEDLPEVVCWHCKKTVQLPMRLVILNSVAKNVLFITPSLKVVRSMIEHKSKKKNEIVAAMVQNPNNPAQWGLRNLTKDSWQYKLPDGELKEVEPGRAVPLNPKLEIIFNSEAKGSFVV